VHIESLADVESILIPALDHAREYEARQIS